MDHEKNMRRAHEAERILGNDLFVEAFATLRDGYTKMWQNSGVLDTDAREVAYRGLRTLEAVRKHFENVITTGKISEAEIKAMQDQKPGLVERLRRAV